MLGLTIMSKITNLIGVKPTDKIQPKAQGKLHDSTPYMFTCYRFGVYFDFQTGY